MKRHHSHPSLKATKTTRGCLILISVFLAFLQLEARQVQFVKIFFPNGSSVTAELAKTPEQRQLGLMFREGINADQGMLLVFEEEDLFSIWMKNMKFSLDLLWLDQEKRIVHIECGVPPCRAEPCATYSTQIPAMYVLELPAGSVKQNSLKLYDRLEFVLPDSSRPFDPD